MSQKSYLDVLSIDLLIKIEQVQFQQPFSGLTFNRWPDTDVNDTAVLLSLQPGFRRVNAVRRKLLVMSPQVCRRKTEAPAKLFAFRNCSKNRKLASEKRSCEFQSTALDC